MSITDDHRRQNAKHDRPKQGRPPVAVFSRIAGMVTPDERTGCLMFTGRPGPGGVGYVKTPEGARAVHRVLFENETRIRLGTRQLHRTCGGGKLCVSPNHHAVFVPGRSVRRPLTCVSVEESEPARSRRVISEQQRRIIVSLFAGGSLSLADALLLRTVSNRRMHAMQIAHRTNPDIQAVIDAG